jgi:hypothetical protein
LRYLPDSVALIELSSPCGAESLVGRTANQQGRTVRKSFAAHPRHITSPRPVIPVDPVPIPEPPILSPVFVPGQYWNGSGKRAMAKEQRQPSKRVNRC